ncbi:MAG: hypothetical protein LBD70_02245 [Bifidobacteriaceae bacterium]|nr:hypothetical protein [Bifidobacteriaceae bacterium]
MIELTAGPWGNGGICACRQVDGPVVLVSGAVPGERVAAEVTGRARSYWRARVVEVLEPSPDRVEPVWPEGLAVGAADWLHLAPQAARVAKADIVAGLLGRALGRPVGLAVEPVGGGLVLGWRAKIELAVDDQGRAGMFEAGSRRHRPLESMPLAVPAIGRLGLFDRRWPPGSRLTAVAPSLGEAFCLPDAAVSARRRREVVAAGGREHFYELAADGFWQAHWAAPRTLVEAVLAALEPAAGQVIWDLYAGAGLFTLPLAAAGARVSAVEGSRRAVADLRANVGRAGLELDRAQAAGVGAALRAAKGSAMGSAKGTAKGWDKPDAVLLDPPRAGAGRAVMAAVVAAAPARVAYLACEPAALARDLAALTAGGYGLVQLRAFDLFPGTHHVEVLAVAERARDGLYDWRS